MRLLMQTITRKIALTVRFPGAKIAPITSSKTLCQIRLETTAQTAASS